MKTTPAMRSRLEELGIDANRIAKGLYQGSFPAPGSSVQRAGFNAVVFCADELQPDPARYPGVRVLLCPLDDSGRPMLADEWSRAVQMGVRVAHLLDRGARVLVTCAAGRNRSGLVTALALYFGYGHAPDKLAGIVRRARRAPSGPALTNDYFVAALGSLPKLSAAASRP